MRLFCAMILCSVLAGCGPKDLNYKLSYGAGNSQHFLVYVYNNSQWTVQAGYGTNQRGQSGLVVIPSGGKAVFDVGNIPNSVTLSGVSNYPQRTVTYPDQTQLINRDYSPTQASTSFGVP